jgi:DNA replication protein DnaC
MDNISNVIGKMDKPANRSNGSLSLIHTLEEMSLPQCPDCGGAGFFRYDVPPGDPNFGKVAPCRHASHTPGRLARMARVSGLRPQDLDKRLSDISLNDDNIEMMDAARAMLADPYGWLYIWGGPGNAKSEVLIALVNELGQQSGRAVLYTKLSKILTWIKEAFDKKTRTENLNYRARFERLLSVKVLAIDEMDKVKTTDFVDEFRFDFLDERYRQGIAGETITLFAGNADPATFDMPIYDRIRDGRFRIVENSQSSSRPAMLRDHAAETTQAVGEG